MPQQQPQSHPVLIIDLAQRYGGAEVRVLLQPKRCTGNTLTQ